jgi:hypothetical protein
MMVSIFFMACSILHSGTCVEREIQLSNDPIQGVTLLNCQIGLVSQIELAKWQQTHPNWIIGRHRCGPSGQYARA